MSQPRTRPPPKPSHDEPNLTPSTSSRPGDAELAPPSLGPSDVKGAEQSDMGYKSGEETLHGDGDDGDKRDVEAGKVTRDDGAAGDALPLDVEHVFVENDPRQWSDRRKNSVLATIAFTAIGGTITASVFFPALESLQRDLDATDDLVAATTSLFILGQGVFPILWSCVSEVSGRKYCYIAAMGGPLSSSLPLPRLEKPTTSDILPSHLPMQSSTSSAPSSAPKPTRCPSSSPCGSSSRWVRRPSCPSAQARSPTCTTRTNAGQSSGSTTRARCSGRRWDRLSAARSLRLPTGERLSSESRLSCLLVRHMLMTCPSPVCSFLLAVRPTPVLRMSCSPSR